MISPVEGKDCRKLDWEVRMPCRLPLFRPLRRWKTGACSQSPRRYAIRQGTLGVSANYVLTYRGELLTIHPKPARAHVQLHAGADAGWRASRIFFDGLKPTALPDSARPVLGVLGIGVLYADPRFKQAYACFGGGLRIAQVCFAARDMIARRPTES